MKIVMIVGSLRHSSFNRHAAQIVEKKLVNLGHNVEYLPIDSVPLLNTDLDVDPPAGLIKAFQMVKEADGVFVYSPENNGQMPGGLKNLLDWLTHNGSEYGNVLAGKPVAIASLAGGSAGAGVLKNLKEYFKYPYVAGKLMDDGLGQNITPKMFETGEFELPDEDVDQINKYAEQFAEFIKTPLSN